MLLQICVDGGAVATNLYEDLLVSTFKCFKCSVQRNVTLWPVCFEIGMAMHSLIKQTHSGFIEAILDTYSSLLIEQVIADPKDLQTELLSTLLFYAYN